MTNAAVPPPAPAPPVHERPRWAPLAIAAWAGLVVCGYVATALAPSWSNEHPALLILLHARVRHLLLSLGGGIGVIEYVVIAGFRLALAYAVCHLIGRAYGNSILLVFGKYLGVTREQIDGIFDGLDRLRVVIIPIFVGSNVIAAITGIRRMDPRPLAVLVTIGILGRLALYYWLSRVFADQLDTVLDFFRRYTGPSLVASIALVVLFIFINVRRGRDFTL